MPEGEICPVQFVRPHQKPDSEAETECDWRLRIFVGQIGNAAVLRSTSGLFN